MWARIFVDSIDLLVPTEDRIRGNGLREQQVEDIPEHSFTQQSCRFNECSELWLQDT